MQNKTAIEWLNEARANGEPWVDQAVENIAAQPDYIYREEDYPALSSVVYYEFAWSNASQGGDYWGEIYLRLRSEN